MKACEYPVGASVVRQTTMMANVMTLSGWRAQVRNRIIETVARHHRFRRALAVSTTETSVAYPSSPIVASSKSRPRHSLEVGGYTPDVPGLRDVQGQEVRIGDLLQQPGHVLLALTHDPENLARLRVALGPIGAVVPVLDTAASATAGSIVDPSGMIAAHLGIGQHGLALIRPDAYIGYLSPSTDPGELSAYLRDQLHLTSDLTSVSPDVHGLRPF